MAHSSDVKHDYHLVDPSPWPFVASVCMFVLALGGVVYMRGLVETDTPGLATTLLAKGSPWIMFLGLFGIAMTCAGWWGDVIKESRRGDHKPVVDIGLRYGMILFIASEVMFFVAWFWVFFELAIFHGNRTEVLGEAWANWPPPNVVTFDPFALPLINTLILLLSGTTVTWAHHALQVGDRKSARNGLIITILLGMAFTALQVVEYGEAGFAFGNQGDITTANLYGAAFFMATGFHGFHVVVGTVFLAVCLFRLMAGQMSPQKHFGFEAAAWYWHFVDVVWLFLFAFVYVLPKLMLE